MSQYELDKSLLIAARDNADPRLVENLIKAGANVDIKGLEEFFTTPLMLAVEHNDMRIAKILIRAGANVNARSDYHLTALILASGADESNPEVIDLLIDAGADVNAEDDEGQNALYSALISSNPQKVEIIRKLIKAGIDVNNRTGNYPDMTPLMYANASPPEIVDMLIKAGADVNASFRSAYNVTEFTVLAYFLRNEDTNPKNVALIVQAGANPFIRDKITGQTLIEVAKEHKNPEILTALMNAIPKKQSITQQVFRTLINC